MSDTPDFRRLVVELCQAPLPAAGRLLDAHPELLGAAADDSLTMLGEVSRARGDWRSQATFRRVRALVRRAAAVGVAQAVREAAAAEAGEIPDDLAALFEGAMSDAAEPLALMEQVLEHPVLDRVPPGLRWAVLGDSAALLFGRWERAGDRADLDTAIDRWQQLTLETVAGAPASAALHDNLAVAYLARYTAGGARSDLTAALDRAGTALSEAGAGDDHAKLASDLAGALQESYAATGDLSDLERAIQLYEDAAGRFTPDTAHQASILNNFGTALMDRFRRTGDQADRDRAAALQQDAVARTAPADPHRPQHQSNLAQHAPTSAEQIAQRRAAVAAPSANPAIRAADLYNLAFSLLSGYENSIFHDWALLDEAVDVFEEAIDAADPDSPDYALYNIGAGQARRLASDAEVDNDEAFSHLLRGMDVLGVAIAAGMERAPAIALEAARAAGDWQSSYENWPQAVRYYGRGLAAAERLLQVQARRADQENWLHTISDLHPRAAYASAADGDARAAVLALERGRAVVLTETLKLRDAGLEQLDRPELRDRFGALVDRWNRLAGR